jgi:hypothetical protein
MAKTGGEASRIGTPLHLVLESLTLCLVAGNGVFVCHVVLAKQLFHVWLLRWRLLCLPFADEPRGSSETNSGDRVLVIGKNLCYREPSLRDALRV